MVRRLFQEDRRRSHAISLGPNWFGLNSPVRVLLQRPLAFDRDGCVFLHRHLVLAINTGLGDEDYVSLKNESIVLHSVL